MIQITNALDAELAELRGAAQVELAQMAEETGLDLGPPDPAGLSDLALNLAREVDRMRVEVRDMAQVVGRAAARRRAKLLVGELAEELLVELQLVALGVG